MASAPWIAGSMSMPASNGTPDCSPARIFVPWVKVLWNARGRRQQPGHGDYQKHQDREGIQLQLRFEGIIAHSSTRRENPFLEQEK